MILELDDQEVRALQLLVGQHVQGSGKLRKPLDRIWERYFKWHNIGLLRDSKGDYFKQFLEDSSLLEGQVNCR